MIFFHRDRAQAPEGAAPAPHAKEALVENSR